MKINFAVKVDIGPKETNDDRVSVFGENITVCDNSGSVESPAAAVVCDGCGGYDGGFMAAETIIDVLSEEKPEDLADAVYLSEILEKCHQAVLDKKLEMPHFSKMCSTVAGCIFTSEKIVIFHAGDSRVYRFDGKYLSAMTTDHSRVQMLLDAGQINPEDLRKHPERNVISRCIGVDSLPPEIYTIDSPLKPGEMYLFCSDGLWESVEDREIKEILLSDGELNDKVTALVEKALKQGANDNISVCICSNDEKTEKQENKPFVLD